MFVSQNCQTPSHWKLPGLACIMNMMKVSKIDVHMFVSSGTEGTPPQHQSFIKAIALLANLKYHITHLIISFWQFRLRYYGTAAACCP